MNVLCLNRKELQSQLREVAKLEEQVIKFSCKTLEQYRKNQPLPNDRRKSFYERTEKLLNWFEDKNNQAMQGIMAVYNNPPNSAFKVLDSGIQQIQRIRFNLDILGEMVDPPQQQEESLLDYLADAIKAIAITALCGSGLLWVAYHEDLEY